MNSLRKFMIGFVAGIITSLIAGGAYLYCKSRQAQPLADVKVTQIYGEKITHNSFDYSLNDRIKFTTHAAGEGTISTEIPKANIPEARAWMQKIHGLAVDFILTDHRIYGISYLHRWDSFVLGGGPLFSEKHFEGLKIQGQIWF